MTISSTTMRAAAAGNGVTTAFSYPYRFLADADLDVYIDGTLKTLTTHYTVTGAGDPSGGTVTFLTAPANGTEVVIVNNPDATQSLDLVDNDPLPADDLEAALDRLTLLVQRERDQRARALVLADSDTSTASLVLPTPESSKVLAWNLAADALENYDVSALGVLTLAAGDIITAYLADGVLSADAAGRLKIADGYFADTAAMRAKFANGFVHTALIEALAVTDAKLAATLDLSSKTLTLSAAQKANDYVEVRDEKTAGTHAGDAVAGSWATRTLNTEHADTGNHASLAADQITLAAGTYECYIRVPAYAVGRHQARLRNKTDAVTTLVGASAVTVSSATDQADSIITGRFTIAASKAFEVQQQVASNQANGLGTASNFGETEVYTVARFWKVG